MNETSGTLDFTPQDYRAWLEAHPGINWVGTMDPLSSFINDILGYQRQQTSGVLLHDGFQPGRGFPWVALPAWARPIARKYQAAQREILRTQNALADLDEALAHREAQS